MVSGPDETHQSQEPASRLQWRAQLQLGAVMQPLREQVSSCGPESPETGSRSQWVGHELHHGAWGGSGLEEKGQRASWGNTISHPPNLDT